MAAFTTLALLLAGAGTAVSAVSQIKAGNAQKKAGESADDASRRAGLAQQRSAESQAGLQDFNAQVADLQAVDAVQRGAEEESRFRTNVRGVIGSQRTGTAANNIDVGYGSAVDLNADASFLGELDALTIRTNAAREAWGFKVQGEDLRRGAAITRQEGANAAEAGAVQGAAYRTAGNAASTAAKWGVAGTLLGTGSSLLMSKYGMGRR